MNHKNCSRITVNHWNTKASNNGEGEAISEVVAFLSLVLQKMWLFKDESSFYKNNNNTASIVHLQWYWRDWNAIWPFQGNKCDGVIGLFIPNCCDQRQEREGESKLSNLLGLCDNLLIEICGPRKSSTYAQQIINNWTKEKTSRGNLCRVLRLLLADTKHWGEISATEWEI